MTDKEYDIKGIEKILRKSREEENYLKCQKISTKLSKIDPGNKVALEYYQKLQLVDLDGERDEWYQSSNMGRFNEKVEEIEEKIKSIDINGIFNMFK